MQALVEAEEDRGLDPIEVLGGGDGTGGLQDTDSTSSDADSSQVRRQRRHRPVAPPGLELMEDINPGYDTAKAPPFTVPMEAVAQGGVVFDTAMRSLEVLERADCKDLWQVCRCRYLYPYLCMYESMDGWMDGYI